MEQELILLLKTISWPGAIALLFWSLRPVWVALANKISGGRFGDEDRINNLEEFRAMAENNHFHELKDLSVAFEKLRVDFDNYRVAMENRLTKVEARVFNGHKING